MISETLPERSNLTGVTLKNPYSCSIKWHVPHYLSIPIINSALVSHRDKRHTSKDATFKKRWKTWKNVNNKEGRRW